MVVVEQKLFDDTHIHQYRYGYIHIKDMFVDALKHKT